MPTQSIGVLRLARALGLLALLAAGCSGGGPGGGADGGGGLDGGGGGDAAVTRAPSCSDNLKNGDETDVDCGGACPKCGGGKGCVVPTDCVTNLCNAGKCAAGPLMLGTGESYPIAHSGWGIVAADFNGDGKLDVAVSAADGVEVLLGNGDGTLGAAASYGNPGANSIPGDLAAADFNHDAKVDLVWPDFNHDLAYVALGNGDGTFPAAKTTPVSGGPQTAILGDFDGDGRPDVAMGLAIGNAVAVMTGNGDGTFGTPATYPSGGTNADCLGALDLDGDGKQDLIVGNSGTDWQTGATLTNGSVYSLLNTGVGTFKAATKLFDAGQPATLVVADLSGNGKPDDFALADLGALKMLAQVKGAALASYDTGLTPLGIGAGDLNLDGEMDLVVSHIGTNRLTVFLGTGRGAFDQGAKFPLALPNPGRLAIGDFNGDGKPDVALINYNADQGATQPVVMIVLNATM